MRYDSHDNTEDKEARLAFLKTVGKQIKQKRTEMKWTQERFAHEVGINEKYVYDVESGKKCMSIWILMKIAQAFGVDVNDLVEGI